MYIRNIKIKGGVRNTGNYADIRITEKGLQTLVAELSDLIKKHIPSETPAWIEMTYEHGISVTIND